MGRSAINLEGRRFGNLIVKSRSPNRIIGRGSVVSWFCQCDCGKIKTVYAYNLTRKISPIRSCGCIPHRGKHGHCRRRKPSPEYVAYNAMLQRCYYKNYQFWHCYGGRGIRVCKRWRRSFENFLADMGCKPSRQHSLDRIDNEGNYEPGNCRWATAKEQRNNRRDHKLAA